MPQLQFLSVLKKIEIKYYFYLENTHHKHDFYEELIFDFLSIHVGHLSSQLMVSWGM